jgi:hypothetical protein
MHFFLPRSQVCQFATLIMWDIVFPPKLPGSLRVTTYQQIREGREDEHGTLGESRRVSTVHRSAGRQYTCKARDSPARTLALSKPAPRPRRLPPWWWREKGSLEPRGLPLPSTDFCMHITRVAVNLEKFAQASPSRRQERSPLERHCGAAQWPSPSGRGGLGSFAFIECIYSAGTACCDLASSSRQARLVFRQTGA